LEYVHTSIVEKSDVGIRRSEMPNHRTLFITRVEKSVVGIRAIGLVASR